MPKRSSKPKRPTDPNLLVRQIVEETIGEPITPKPEQPERVLPLLR